jgi:hypothetical protein
MTRKPSPRTRRARAGSAATTPKSPVKVRPVAAAPAPGRRRATPTEQFVTELLSLKQALDAAVSGFGARISGQLADVLRATEGAKPPAKRTLRAMVARIQDVKLKPEKGRIKDLVRLQRLADDLAELLSER